MNSLKLYGELSVKSLELLGITDLPAIPSNGMYKLYIKDDILCVMDDTGKLLQVEGNTIVNDVSNPLTTTSLEYGYFSILAGSYSPNTILPVTLLDGNFENNGTIGLLKGKTYKITINGNNNTPSSSCNVVMYDIDKATTYRYDYAILSNINGTPTSKHGELTITPEVDVNYKFILEGTLASYSLGFIKINVQEIRNNPVNQYGGFETEVIFDGNATTTGEYMLSDDISNYNCIMIQKYQYETKKFDIAMTSNTTPSPFIVKQSSILSTSSEGWKVFDKKNASDSDCWHSAGGEEQWVSIDLNTQIKIYSYDISARNGVYSSTLYPIKKIILMGSNDGEFFTPIHTETFNSWGVGEKKTVIVDGDVAYKEYKWQITGSGGYVAVGEIEVFERLDEFSIKDCCLLTTDVPRISNDVFNFNIKNNILTQKSEKKISRIIGIKGQIPTILSGGKF